MDTNTSYIDVMPNTHKAPIKSTHKVYVEGLCPVSTNPKHGSYIEITYTADQFFLEVYSLKSFVDSFTGGKRYNGQFIRDMEQTIQIIAAECAKALEVSVTVKAVLILDTQELVLTVDV